MRSIEGSMAQEVDEILEENLALRDEVERQRRLIEDLTRPQHWTFDGPRGAQATAVHHALDHVLEGAIKVRNLARPGREVSRFEKAAPVEAIEAPVARDGFYIRMQQAADLLGGRPEHEGPALVAFIEAAGRSKRPASQLGWLGLTAALGKYPRANELERATRSIRDGGIAEFADLLRAIHLESLSAGTSRPNALGIRTGAVIIDVTHTARHDLHTGIQRVVREVGSRWLDDERSVLVWWDDQRHVLRELGLLETYRFRDWVSHLPKEADAEPIIRDFESTPDAIAIPWDSMFLLPELAADHQRSSCYCAFVTSGVITRFGAIGFDLVPVAAAETVHEGMVGVFNSHLSVIKHADRLSAISESAANEFRALCQALSAQGLSGPVVEAHPLPPTQLDVNDDRIAEVRSSLANSDAPVILVVGSREPRKNQIAVLEAAGHLSAAGNRFHLVMVGGSGWNSGDIDEQIDRLRSLGVDITVRKRATEAELFAWYRIARFSVFPSLYEGYGLPIAESLGAGTPVITSNYGSMSEVAAPGGALLVDPRDPVALREAMERMLSDDDLVASLTSQARARIWPTWESYARDVWHHLVESNDPLPV